MRFACFYEIQHNTAEEKKGRLSNPILDDMKTEAVKQTNYDNSMVTAQGKMDQERKSIQSCTTQNRLFDTNRSIRLTKGGVS